LAATWSAWALTCRRPIKSYFFRLASRNDPLLKTPAPAKPRPRAASSHPLCSSAAQGLAPETVSLHSASRRVRLITARDILPATPASARTPARDWRAEESAGRRACALPRGYISRTRQPALDIGQEVPGPPADRGGRFQRHTAGLGGGGPTAIALPPSAPPQAEVSAARAR